MSDALGASRIRTLIVDDESLAREGVRRLLADEPDVEIVGESPDGLAAVADVQRLRPDLVVLDVQLPELSGFEVLESVRTEWLPVVIFVTAHESHALQAFEAHAIDYLLKPVEPARFRVALERARAQLRRPDDGSLVRRLEALVHAAGSAEARRDRVLLKIDGSMVIVRSADIAFVQADGNYAWVHIADQRAHLVRETMAALEARLDPARFIRIHRSTIVNLDRVREIRAMPKGALLVVLAGGQRLPLSRKYRAALERRVGRAL